MSVLAPEAAAAPLEIVLDNGSAGVTETGAWQNAASATQHYGSMSRYAVAGGSVDVATYGPTLPEAGTYDVFAWNSYYANRATNVPHRIVHRDGATVVSVNQSGSGSYGEWLLLGRFNFDVGSSGRVEISDAGLAPTTTTYIGADAVRFVKIDDAPPPPPPPPPPPSGTTFVDTFGEDVTPLDSSYVTYKASALPLVGKRSGRYYAEVANNDNNVTLHYNQAQGRIDAQLISFPFEAIARNIGVGRVDNTQVAPTGNSLYMLCGVMVHVLELEERNSAFVAVGHRGVSPFTVEGKNTVNGVSTVTDLGANRVPAGRADVRIVGNSDRTLTVYWQQPNPNPGTQADNWQLYEGTGRLPGAAPVFDPEVYVGLITFASGTAGLPFAGTVDSFEIRQL